MDQLRLFKLAPEAVTITAQWHSFDGWQVILRLRRSGEAWTDAYRADYTHLTTVEMVDVLMAELDALL